MLRGLLSRRFDSLQILEDFPANAFEPLWIRKEPSDCSCCGVGMRPLRNRSIQILGKPQRKRLLGFFIVRLFHRRHSDPDVAHDRAMAPLYRWLGMRSI